MPAISSAASTNARGGSLGGASGCVRAALSVAMRSSKCSVAVRSHQNRRYSSKIVQLTQWYWPAIPSRAWHDSKGDIHHVKDARNARMSIPSPWAVACIGDGTFLFGSRSGCKPRSCTILIRTQRVPRNGTEGPPTRLTKSPACIAFDRANDQESHTGHDAPENPKLS